MEPHGHEPLYARQMIMNPMLRLASDGPIRLLHDDVLRALNEIPLVRDRFVGWGKECRYERDRGRGGICTFAVKHAAVARDVSFDIMKLLMPHGRSRGACSIVP